MSSGTLNLAQPTSNRLDWACGRFTAKPRNYNCPTSVHESTTEHTCFGGDLSCSAAPGPGRRQAAVMNDPMLNSNSLDHCTARTLTYVTTSHHVVRWQANCSTLIDIYTPQRRVGPYIPVAAFLPCWSLFLISNVLCFVPFACTNRCYLCCFCCDGLVAAADWQQRIKVAVSELCWSTAHNALHWTRC